MAEPPAASQHQTDGIGDADVHAFLIADVRGYTAFTREGGDEKAAALAGRFAEVTRAVIQDHRGRVLELRGDEALVVFGSPRSAIRGAVALQQRFVEETLANPSLPLTVGIGLDVGEAVPLEGGYRGGALNVAARLCSLARAGEVLASREIVHLATRIDGVRFTERGQAELKGLDQPVHVVAVRSEDRDEAKAIAPFVRSALPPSRRGWRWKAAAAAVAVVVLGALIAVPIVTRRAGGSSEIEPNSIGILDPESGEVTATVGLEDRPGSVAASADAVWVTNPDVDTVTRINPDDHTIVDSIQVGENPTGIAVGEDAVWVVESGGPSVSRISPDTDEIVKTIPVGNGPTGVAVGDGSVWVTNRFDATIWRIDPGTNAVVEKIPVGLDPRGIATGFGSVWVGLTGSNTVVRVNPQTSAVTRLISVGNAPGSLAVSADAVWVVNTLDDTVSRISPDTNSVVDLVPVGDGPSGIAVVDGIVWVANEADGTLSRIDPGQTSDQSSVSGLAIGSVPQGLAAVDGDLWVSVHGSATSHRGGTLRLISDAAPPSIDPGFVYENYAWPVLHLLGDGLVAFEPIGGANSTLVPDLATSIPAPTDGGLTYTFDLRPEIPYSNGEIVAPGDFRYALERGFRIEDVGHPYLYAGLVGGKACVNEPRTCDLSRGIVTDNVTGTITFKLVEPDPEFLYKLTLPFAYPVPPSTPSEHQRTEGVPGTGPYMVGTPMTSEGLALVRNPYFRVWSSAQPDGYVDRIEWSFGVRLRAQVEVVAAGDADVAFEIPDSGSLEEIFVRFAGQVHTSPATGTEFFVLNTETPPFNDVHVRRAMNLAFDRDWLVQALGGERVALPACQTLPPNFPGYEPYCPYTSDPGPDGLWTAPNLQEAQRIVRGSGTKGMRVEFEYPPANYGHTGARIGEYMVDLLEELGYRGSVKTISLGEYNGEGNEFQMTLAGWFADYPAASNLLASLHRCGATVHPGSGFCDRRIDAMIDRAIRVQADDPAASGELWAEIDREIVDKAPLVWSVNFFNFEFLSERVGNYQRHLQWGLLLNQLWVE